MRVGVFLLPPPTPHTLPPGKQNVWSGPVSRILFPAPEREVKIIRLPRALPRWSSNLPEAHNGDGRLHDFPIWSCSAGGLPCRPRLRGTRCALTAPFHPYLLAVSLAASGAIGGLFSVALSVASPRLAVSQPAARESSDFPRRLATPRSSSPLHTIERNRIDVWPFRGVGGGDWGVGEKPNPLPAPRRGCDQSPDRGREKLALRRSYRGKTIDQ